MARYDGSGSGIYILQVTSSGVTPIAAEGYVAATGATGAGGIYASSGFQHGAPIDFLFYSTTGSGYLKEHNPTSEYIATGSGKLLGQDIRGSGNGYMTLDDYTPAVATGLDSQVEYFVGAYARYTDSSSKTLTGLISGNNGFYTGSYTTLPTLHEFDVVPPVTGANLANVSTGSGVHLYKDVTLTFSDIVDRQGNNLLTQEQLQNNIFFEGFDIDILDSRGGMAFTGYKSGVKSRTFTFTEQENIEVFGSYQSDFGVRYAVQDQNGSEQISEFYLYANVPQVESVYVTDSSGQFLNESNASDYVTTGTTAEELYLTNKQPITGRGGVAVSPETGMIGLEVRFTNDPRFTNFGDTLNLYGRSGDPTGVNDPATGKGVSSSTVTHFREAQDNFLTQFKPPQNINFNTQIGGADLVPPDATMGYILEPHSMGSKLGQPFVFQGFRVDPLMDPDNAGHPLFNVGDQYIWDGSLEIEGCVVAECLTVQTTDYPCTLKTAGAGKVGINACDPTSPLTVVTDTVTDSGIDLYAHGDYGNQIITLGTDANNAGRLVVKDSDGDDTVSIYNDSSRGSVDLHDDGGTVRTKVIVDSNNQGKMTLLDSSANDSVILSSDSNKRGNLTLHDSAGVARVSALVDSNEQGELTLKDSSANDSVKLTSDSNKRGNINVYDAAGAIRVIMKADSNDKGQMSIKDDAGNESTKVQADKSVISAAYSNIYSTGSVIIGGSGHIISGDYDVIAGGADNQISGIGGNFNFIGGGSGVDISESKFASSIGGENNDIITGDYSIIAGGKNNLISGNSAANTRNVIGGGLNNSVKNAFSSIVAGGESNTITGDAACIMGGTANTIEGRGYSVIGGGEANKARGVFSAILGGENNEASGSYSVVAGGDSNSASGDYSFVGNGLGNKASGEYSFALGRKALIAATHSGAAVLADGQDRVHASSGDHTLNLDFASGVYIGGGGALYVSGNPVMTGAHTVEADTLQTVTARGATTNQAISITNTSSSALAVSTDALVVDGSNDRVGIGTASNISNKLDVNGSMAVGAGGYYAGSTSAPTDGMIIKGVVGIGTTSPALDSDFHVWGSGIIGRSFSSAPVDGLAVYGAVGIGTNTAGSKLDVNGNVAIGSSFMGYGGPSNGLAVAGNVGIGTYSAGNALDIYGAALIGQNYSSAGATAPSNGMIVEGNVGVGTSSPKTALDVRGTISGYTGLFDDKVGIGTNAPTEMLGIAPNTDVSAEIGRAHVGSVGHTDYAGFSHIDKNTTTSYALLQQSNGATYLNAANATNIYFRMNNTSVGGFNSSTDFYVNTDTLYVDASEDRVGINESSPSYTLDVTASDASSLLSRFYNSSSTNGQGLLIRAGETANANRILQCASRNDTKIMTVNSNGSVGVGTDSPYGRFDIVSSRNAENDLSDADNYHLHLHNNGDDTDESVGIGFGITSDTDAIGACIGHERKGALSFGDLFFATKPDGGSVTERLRIASNGNVGIGTNAPANALDVVGHFSATSKSFVIDHPTKENKKLQYGSLEGPEHGVFVRGTTSKNVIKLPDYWKDLVHEDSITVTLTPVHSFQSLYVKSKTPEQIVVGGVKNLMIMLFTVSAKI
jgi:hypothetical protein